MFGAVAGDIIGSPWEGSSCDNPKQELFGFGCQITDDTVCTVAIADALLHKKDIAQTLRDWVRRYPGRGYGGMFIDWALSESQPAYNSFGNGGAMRVSPVALFATSEEGVLSLAEKTAAVTHSHLEGIKGAQAIALSIWMARNGHAPQAIRSRVSNLFGYDLSASVSERASIFGLSVLAEETVPDALVSALESTSYEQAIRNALRIGGDSDTIACMAGGIAEALFGMPSNFVANTRIVLPAEMTKILDHLYAHAGMTGPKAPISGALEGKIKSWLPHLLSLDALSSLAFLLRRVPEKEGDF